MQIIEFQNQLSSLPVFSWQEIKKIFPNFFRIQLDRWGRKGYLQKIKQGYYYLTNQKIDQEFLFYTANKIYSPSYVSLEKALEFYNFIPEKIFQITSINTKKTTRFNTSIGNFRYQHLKPSLFFGYDLLDFGEQRIMIADPEKAILDYLYLNPRLKTTDDFLEMRLNNEEFLQRINLEKFQRYLAAFKNKSLSRRVKIFLTTIKNA